jgi:hypothetical protein
MFEAMPRGFKTQFRCFSVVMFPGNEREDVERGGKSNIFLFYIDFVISFIVFLSLACHYDYNFSLYTYTRLYFPIFLQLYLLTYLDLLVSLYKLTVVRFCIF